MGARFSAPVQTGPGAHPASCTMGTGSFPGVKSGRGVKLTPHPLLVPWSRKGRAIPLLTLWAVRPVQSLSACTRVHFTLYRPIHTCIYINYSLMCKGKVPLTSHKGIAAAELWSSLLTSVLDGAELTASSPGRFTSTESDPGIH